jgi:nitrogenase molybdenum-iron protein NifN
MMTETVSKTTVKQVNENQCHMCMPLGGVVAFKGIENTMVLVHGSQGCSTYMRLANVEHYHEPIDVASSSLNEKQTIYGGEKNLRKGLDNVRKVYNPKVIGVVTTCLAETMGEDLNRMIAAYKLDNNLDDVDIIPVSTPSYTNSHSEGFWSATRAVIEYYAKPCEQHNRINVIIPHISAADIRELKRILDVWGFEYTLIPDYSMTIDRPFTGKYKKIGAGGTNTGDISRMPGAPVTIQFGRTCEDKMSPGLYLKEKFGVPLVNLPLPIGVENTDLLMKALGEIAGKSMPKSIKNERGWLIDAMADSHKYNASARPLIYGEPELIYGYTCMCMENGSYPAVIATGSQSSLVSGMLEEVLVNSDEEAVIIEDADFATIEDAVLKAGSNLAIGHSGGKFLTENYGIPIVRAGFPIHDRVGGQRILSVGYVGTLAFLDRFTNTILERKLSTYREARKTELLSKLESVSDKSCVME